MRKKIFSKFRKEEKLKEEKSDSQNSNSEQDCPEIPGLPNPNWVKVGHVKKLNICPVDTGESLPWRTLQFTQGGIFMEYDGMIFWDKMFRVYDKKAKRFLIGQELESILILRAIDLHETGGKFVFLPNTPILNVYIDKKPVKLVKCWQNWNQIGF
ncbi:PREDICTED: uncharacterized protein LOC105560457 [Vollenhovia emeryi]|uniref:uncharacterized protein LOC105560457 n=1 Tax=Vollenhovia emeryi TaxID=411798 RepID=UPI0005F4A3A2|nr:PREDICTED: uncharacterized protein LOC105560457 [Vollenhovia emeryi]XP_011864986.1 PREDICTED: uncharacterized protein LOC105560457 [Vollenhovia emeryi]XP_011864987.1 PREDICTED: uncharacterized protein LOC105560457 [Vollenhovia emeryi]